MAPCHHGLAHNHLLLSSPRHAHSLEIVLHLPQRVHDLNRICLAGDLLDLGVLRYGVSAVVQRRPQPPTVVATHIDPHERVMLLRSHYWSATLLYPRGAHVATHRGTTYLLVPDGKLALRLPVALGKVLQLPEGLALQHRRGELDVALGVLVAGEHPGVIGQRGERLIQRGVHLPRVALEELATAGVEQRVAREDDLVRAVLHEPADAVLRMARRVQALDGDAADLEARAVGRRLRDGLGVLAGDDGQVGQAELFSLFGGYSVSCRRLVAAGEPTSFLLPPAWSQWLRGQSVSTLM